MQKNQSRNQNNFFDKKRFGAHLLCPFFMIKHDKCASFEAEIDRLKKENDEMKVILIFLLLAWPNPDKKEEKKHYNFDKTLKAFQ